ncbi:MAG TPA: sulfotransferase domain-containing protein [Bacteroidia bacterium]|jgi:hypothetical protein|nr:sulfotransferase domain-containing protein [Bacteroidia bacterium]
MRKLLDKFHTWSNSLIKDRLPLVSLYYYIKPRSWLYWRTQPIHQLLNGIIENKCPKKSVLFFTAHKSASSFFNWYLKDLSVRTGQIHIDINGYFGTQGPAGIQKQNSEEFKNKAFKKIGFIYGPLRNYIAVPEIEDYPIVLVLRDPRDVLTSQYFSIKNSHPLITSQLIERRKIAQASTIDEHVLSNQSDRFVKTYNEYLTHVYGKKNVLFIKYEELISDFKTCLEKINKHCGFELTQEQINLLDKSAIFKAKKEDQHTHVRKISSGDHKEKLKPETIKILNKKFGTILEKLNYSL